MEGFIKDENKIDMHKHRKRGKTVIENLYETAFVQGGCKKKIYL